MSIQTFQGTRKVEKFFYPGIILYLVLKLGLPLYGLIQLDVQNIRYHLCDTIHIAIGNIQGTTDIAYDGARLHFTERDDLGYLVAPVLLHYITDNVVPTLRTKISVDIRHTDSIR